MSKLRTLIIDNFYENPKEVRNFALQQKYEKVHLPRYHTKPFFTEEHIEIFQKLVEPFAGKIVKFDNDDNDYNGSFNYSTCHYTAWNHIDKHDWAGIIYLTPDAPVSSGTNFYRFCDGTMCENDMILKNNKSIIETSSCDVTKWDLVDSIGNIYNRLILYNSKYFHKAASYFGNDLESGRLFQVFFFNTEIPN